MAVTTIGVFENNIIIDNSTTSFLDIALSVSIENGTFRVENNFIVCTNSNSSFCMSLFASGTGTFTSNNNATSDGTADDFGGTGHLTNVSQSAVFTSISGKDFSHKSTSPLLNLGKTLSTNQIDIKGTARPQGDAYDIGAFEYIVALWSDVIVVPRAGNTIQRQGAIRVNTGGRFAAATASPPIRDINETAWYDRLNDKLEEVTRHG